MIGLDTDILLRWLIDESIWPDDNPGQLQAVETLLSDDARSYFVNSIVLSEVLWILTKRAGQPKSVILEIIERLLLSANVEVQHREAVEATSKSFAANKSGIHDRLIAEINAQVGCETTFTFDKAASRTPGFTLLDGRS